MGRLVVERGITESQVEELAHYAANDPDVIRNTHDSQRFATVEKAKEWTAGDRKIYTLTDSSRKLLGIIWFQELDLPEGDFTEEIKKKDYKNTFAIRLYPPARGKGISRKFMDFCFADAGLTKAKVWLSTSHKNEVALKLYNKFGFRQVTTPNEENRVIMVYDGT